MHLEEFKSHDAKAGTMLFEDGDSYVWERKEGKMHGMGSLLSYLLRYKEVPIPPKK